MENIFELATRKKLRFATDKIGNLTIEDLWALKLEELDVAARMVNKSIRDTSGDESFIGKQSTGDRLLKLKLEILKSIIATKMAEEEKKTSAAARKAKREQILELIANKENDKLAGKSLTALRAELDKLEDEETEE